MTFFGIQYHVLVVDRMVRNIVSFTTAIIKKCHMFSIGLRFGELAGEGSRMLFRAAFMQRPNRPRPRAPDILGVPILTSDY